MSLPIDEIHVSELFLINYMDSLPSIIHLQYLLSKSSEAFRMLDLTLSCCLDLDIPPMRSDFQWLLLYFA